MAHLCVPQNPALGVCRGFVPDIQICGTHGREDLVNAAITSNAEEEEFIDAWNAHVLELSHDRMLNEDGGSSHLFATSTV